MSVINDLFSKLLVSLKKSSKSVLGIDVGTSSIKIVQLKKKGGRAVLETYGELSLGPYAGTEIGRATNLEAAKISEALLDLLRESNATTTECGAAIPTLSSLVTLIDMPHVSQDELAQMIPIEARKYIPVPIGEVALDWWVVPKEGDSSDDEESTDSPQKTTKKINVLLVVIHNDVIAKYNHIMSLSKLSSSFFEIEIFSSIRSILGSQDISPVMIADLGASSTKLYIVERGIIQNSHTINRGSQDITISISKALFLPIINAEMMKRTIGLEGGTEHAQMTEIMSLALSTIFTEANRVLLAYEQKSQKNISKVILTGGGSTLKGLLKIASENFASPVSLADPFSKTVAPAFLEPVLKSAGPEFAVAVGIALRKLQESD